MSLTSPPSKPRREYKIGEIVDPAPPPKLSIRPAFVDKLSHPRGTFNRGRKQTI